MNGLSEQKNHSYAFFPIWRCILFLILLLISYIAINVQTVAVDISGLTAYQDGYSGLIILVNVFRDVMGTIQPVQAIAAVAIIWLYFRNILKKGSKFYPTSFILGGIFSLCLLIGMSFSKYEGLNFITQSNYQLIVAIIVLIGYWGILYAIICEILKKLDTIKLSNRTYNGLFLWIDQHLFLVSVIVILLCWLPWCIIYYPGSVGTDTQWQLNQIYGISGLSNHHPVTSTFILGAFIKLGDILYSKDFGIALYMIFQTIVCAIIFADICVYLRKKKVPLSFTIGAVLFYALVPTFGAYAQAVIKDTLYYGIFAWFVLEYIKCFLGDNEKFSYLWLAIASSLVCLLRNEGIYIILPSLFILIFMVKNKRWAICAILAAALISGIGINHILLESLGIRNDEDNTKESLSVPFLQIARYVRDYGYELTDEEIKIIDSILEYDTLAQNYEPEVSDSVKETFRRNVTDEEWSAFWQLWAQKLIEHPEVFTEAAICQCYGYFDPFYVTDRGLGYFLDMRGRITLNENEPVYATYVFPEGLRNILRYYALFWSKIPILSFFLCCGTYTWIGFLLLALLLRRKDWRDALIFLIPALNIIICCLSPVNGFMRYYLPVLACIPLYVFIGLKPYLFHVESDIQEADTKTEE